jgi:Glycosyl transferase family 2
VHADPGRKSLQAGATGSLRRLGGELAPHPVAKGGVRTRAWAPSFHHLEHVPAGVALHRIADATGREAEHGGFELGRQLPALHPSDEATGGGVGRPRQLARDSQKILAVLQTVAGELPGRLIGEDELAKAQPLTADEVRVQRDVGVDLTVGGPRWRWTQGKQQLADASGPGGGGEITLHGNRRRGDQHLVLQVAIEQRGRELGRDLRDAAAGLRRHEAGKLLETHRVIPHDRQTPGSPWAGEKGRKSEQKQGATVRRAHGRKSSTSAGRSPIRPPGSVRGAARRLRYRTHHARSPRTDPCGRPEGYRGDRTAAADRAVERVVFAGGSSCWRARRGGGVTTGARPRVIVIMPAYNAARTLAACVADVPRGFVDEIILVDDASADDTVAIARDLGLTVIVHPENRGYGGNQKTCYNEALERGAGIVVMVHPDHQYDPQVIPQLLDPLLEGRADAVFGSRMLGGRAREGGMPWWKLSANVALTRLENAVLGLELTEYHSGFRAYSRTYLESVNLDANSNGFVFDSEIIAQGVCAGMRIAEIPIATRYFPEASQIGLGRSVLYGLGIVRLMIRFALHARGGRPHPQLGGRTPRAIRSEGRVGGDACEGRRRV